MTIAHMDTETPIASRPTDRDMTGELHLPHTPTTWLLLAGSSLIVIAMLVMIAASWNSFSPAGRIITAVIPLVLLYILGFASRKNPEQRGLSRYTILTGSLIFPLVIGVVIYQSGLYRPEGEGVNATLTFLVTLISLVWFLILEFLLDEALHTPLTIVAALSLALSFGSVLEVDTYVYYLLGILLAYFFLSLGWTLNGSLRRWQTDLYMYVGALVGTYSLLALPAAYFQDFLTLPTLVSYGGVAVIFFLVAVFYAGEWQRERSDNVLAVRRLAEQLAALTLTVPAIIICLGTDLTEITLVTFLFGLLALLLGTVVRVATFRYAGLATAIIAGIKILGLAFTSVEAAWPIILLVIGFILIGLAYSLHRVKYQDVLQHLWEEPKQSLFGLGLMPERQVTTASANSTARAIISGLATLFVIYLLLIVLSSL